MTNKSWLGAIGFVGVLTAALLVGTLLYRGNKDTVSAGEVMEEAAQAQTELLQSVKPDSTLHVVFDEHDPSQVDVRRGPGWNPVNTRKEWWAYFSHSGTIEDFRAETTDIDTGELIRVVEYEDGTLTTTYSVVSETSSLPFTWSIPMLREQLIEATNISLGKVIVEADQPAVTTNVGGDTAYVVEEVQPYGVDRIFIDADDFRPVRVEVVENGIVVHATAMPVYEFVAGNVVPAG